MVACAIHRWQKCRSGQPGLLQSPHILLRKQYRLQLLGRRPRGGRAADERDEVAPFHSITSSARSRIEVEISIPIALAVLRLTTSSNLVGCSIGRSVGFAPFAIRSTYSAARWYIPAMLGP